MNYSTDLNYINRMPGDDDDKDNDDEEPTER